MSDFIVEQNGVERQYPMPCPGCGGDHGGDGNCMRGDES